MQLQQQVNQLSTLHISSMQLHMLNSFCQVALWWVLIEKSKWGNKFDRQSKTFLNNTIVILIQCKQLTAKTSIWLISGTEIANSSCSDIFFTNMNSKYPLTWQMWSLPSSTKRILLTVEVALIVNTNIHYCLHLDIWDQFRFLGNCPPTPPLCQHFALSES